MKFWVHERYLTSILNGFWCPRQYSCTHPRVYSILHIKMTIIHLQMYIQNHVSLFSPSIRWSFTSISNCQNNLWYISLYKIFYIGNFTLGKYLHPSDLTHHCKIKRWWLVSLPTSLMSQSMHDHEDYIITQNIIFLYQKFQGKC